MRAVVAWWSSERSNPSRGSEAAAQQLRVPRAVEPVAARRVAVDVPRVDVPVGEPALDRVRLDRARRRPRSTPASGTRARRACGPSIARVSVATRSSSAPDVRRGRLGQVERAEGLLELRADAVERRVRAGGDHRADELERQPDRARLERRQARRRAGTCRRRAPCRRAPRRRAARRRRRSSRRRS